MGLSTILASTKTSTRLPPLVLPTVLSKGLSSEDILGELRRTLLRYGISESGVDHRIGQMIEHFPGAMVTGYLSLTDSMTNHPKDRHVLAAAVRGSAELIVTQKHPTLPGRRYGTFRH